MTKLTSNFIEQIVLIRKHNLTLIKIAKKIEMRMPSKKEKKILIRIQCLFETGIEQIHAIGNQCNFFSYNARRRAILLINDAMNIVNIN